MARPSKSKRERFDATVKRLMLSPKDPAVVAVFKSATVVHGLDRRTRRIHEAGWVYAARSTKFVDSVLKIGQTKVSPLEHVDQLSRSTEHYEPFKLVYFIDA